MRKIAIAALLSLNAIAANAQTRVETTSTSCARIRAILNQNGSAILRQRSTSGIYVKDGRYCGIGQTAQPASVAASDTGNCLVQRCASNARGR
jgi:hypothetical protein